MILVLPIFGGLLFLVFGINRVNRRAKLKEQARDHIVENLPQWARFRLPNDIPLTKIQMSLINVADSLSDTKPTCDNSIELLVDMNRTLGLIEQAILAAEHSLHLEYYIWQPDKTGRRVRDLLVKKARDGVNVRFLYDGLGSFGLNRRFFKPMYDAGIQVATFLPGSGFRQRWSINLRSHRKIVVVDGVVGFTGGMNIGDEYLGKNPALGSWRDTHLRMTGPTVLQLQRVFVEDWYHATGEELVHDELFPIPENRRSRGESIAPSEAQSETQVQPSVGDVKPISESSTANGLSANLRDQDQSPLIDHTVSAQVIAGGPLGEIRAFHSLMFAAITGAEQSVTLATSYFVPTPSLVTALETASYRGVRVRLLVAGRSAHFWTVVAARSYYESLLCAGVEIFEYQSGLLHSKTLTIDGCWSLVGTPNFDARSLLLNFEVGVLLYDARIANRLERHFDHDRRGAKRIILSEWEQRPILHILGESVCRLAAPVL